MVYINTNEILDKIALRENVILEDLEGTKVYFVPVEIENRIFVGSYATCNQIFNAKSMIILSPEGMKADNIPMLMSRRIEDLDEDDRGIIGLIRLNILMRLENSKISYEQESLPSPSEPV